VAAGLWSRIARRIRVPLGFLFAAGYIYFAQPTWWSLAGACALLAPGIALRAAASGHVRKDRELTTSGPYAYTRNPLYLGSVLIASGFALAARNWWLVLALVVLFVAIYLPVISSEEAYLRSTFPAFEHYAATVPRFLPRVPAIRLDNEAKFSRELYLKHREYNSLWGALLMLAALAAKILWFNR
jgi:protein-S-isoprenylcysteine O-methyltransferase Ste14